MWRRVCGRRGQSILEYLVIVGVVVIALFFVKTAVEGNMKNLFTSAANKTSLAQGEVDNLNLTPQ